MASGDETASFALDLRDGMSGPAGDAAAALDQLKKKIEADQRALRSMQQAMSRLRGGTQTNVRAFRELRDRITAQKQAISQSTAKFITAGGSFEDLAVDATKASGGLKELLDAARSTPGPLGAMLGRLGGLKNLLAGGPLVAGALAFAAAMLAIVGASVALVGAVASATAQLLRYGVAQADARRSEMLRLEGLVRIRNWYGLAAGSASELRDAIDRVSDSTSTGRGEVSRYAEQLYRMGLRGGALSEALEGMTIVGSTQGDAMARRFAGMAVGAARTGRSVRALADDVRARLGGIAARQALAFDRQMLSLRENAARLFDGLKIELLLRALRSVTSLFSQSTASGRALRQLAEVIFQPLIDQLAGSGPVVRRFFQGMILGAQRLYIGFLRMRNTIVRTFGGSEVLGAIDRQRVALALGAITVGVFVGAVIAATTVLAALAAPFVLAFAAGFLFVRMIQRVSDELTGLVRVGRTIGTSLVAGLVGGLDAGRSAVLSQIRALASEATGALRDALQIRSPSRVFARLGEQIPRGLAAGVDAGASEAAGAVEGMGGGAAAAGAPGGRAAGRGPTSVTIEGGIHVHMGPDARPRETAQAIVDEVARLLEGAAIELGVPT